MIETGKAWELLGTQEELPAKSIPTPLPPHCQGLDLGPKLSSNRNALAAEVTQPDMRTCPTLCLIPSAFSFALPFAESFCFPAPCVQPLGSQGISHEGVDSTGAGKKPGGRGPGTWTQTQRGPRFLPSPAAWWWALWFSVCLPLSKMGIIPGPDGGLVGMQ